MGFVRPASSSRGPPERQRQAAAVENTAADGDIGNQCCRGCVDRPNKRTEETMGRYALLWLLGVPIPILILIWAFGGLH